MAFDKEQRESERLAVNSTTTCEFASPVLEDFGPVRIKNLSLKGIGLVCSEALAAGMVLAVKLVNPAKSASKTTLVRVVHVTPQAGGTYLVGGTLDTPLTYEELCLFVM
jgi:hypothetical protein